MLTMRKEARSRLVREALVCLATVTSLLGCTAAGQSIEVPLTIRDNFPVVVIQINGNNVPVVLDTGNSASVTLSKEVLDLAKATPIGETSKGMDAKGNIIQSPKFKISSLKIGAAIFTDVIAELDVHDPSYQATQVGQQGFLGTTLLKAYRVVLDYPHRRMTLLPRSSAADRSPDCEGTIVPFSPEWHGEPATVVETDLGRLIMWWDTGTPTSVLSKRFVQNTAINPSLEKVTSKRIILANTDFGPWQFEIWEMSLPPGFDGFIGYDFFANHVVCMDFPSNRLLVQKSKE